MTAISRQGARFGRFSLVGLLGVALQMMLFHFLLRWLPELVAMPIAVEMTVLNNFIWHERFTWGDHRFTGARPRWIGLWRFHAANGLVSLAGNTLLTYYLVQLLQAPPIVAAAAAIAFCAPLNFLLADRFVYRPGTLAAAVSRWSGGKPVPGITPSCSRLRQWL